MDHAVALVQAYLQLNGYFTSAEYPIARGSSAAAWSLALSAVTKWHMQSLELE